MADRIKCNKCKDVKALREFERRPDSKFGYRRTCRECRRAAKNTTNKRYYQRHAERLQEEARARRKENIEKHREADRDYRHKNADKINARQRQYYYRNRDALLAKKRRDYADDPQKYRDRSKTYWDKNLSKRRAYDRQYYALNRAQILLRKRLRRAANPQKYRDMDALRRVIQAEQRRASDALYHLRNKERRNQQSRDHYAANKKPTSLDYGWEDGRPHDRQMSSVEEVTSPAAEVEKIMAELPATERAWCQHYLDSDGGQIPKAILESIKYHLGVSS